MGLDKNIMTYIHRYTIMQSILTPLCSAYPPIPLLATTDLKKKKIIVSIAFCIFQKMSCIFLTTNSFFFGEWAHVGQYKIVFQPSARLVVGHTVVTNEM